MLANKPMVMVPADGSSLASNAGSGLVTRYQVPNYSKRWLKFINYRSVWKPKGQLLVLTHGGLGQIHLWPGNQNMVVMDTVTTIQFCVRKQPRNPGDGLDPWNPGDGCGLYGSEALFPSLSTSRWKVGTGAKLKNLKPGYCQTGKIEFSFDNALQCCNSHLKGQ